MTASARASLAEELNSLPLKLQWERPCGSGQCVWKGAWKMDVWSVWRVCVWTLERLEGACLEGLCGVRVWSARQEGHIWSASGESASGGRVLGNASGACLQRRGGHEGGGACLEHVWSMSRACLECASGACLERARLERIARICRHVRSMCVLSVSGASGRSLEESCLERTSGVGVCI